MFYRKFLKTSKTFSGKYSESRAVASMRQDKALASSTMLKQKNTVEKKNPYEACATE